MKYENGTKLDDSPTEELVTHGEINPHYLVQKTRKSFVRKFLEIYIEGLKVELEILRAPLKS